MGHALERIRQLLKPGGLLIDLHPHHEPPRVSVRLGQERFLAGWVQEEDDYLKYEQAGAALSRAVAQGLFALERRGRFAYTIYAGTAQELQSYFKENWKSAFLDDLVLKQIGEWMASSETDQEIIVEEVVVIARFRQLLADGRLEWDTPSPR